VQAKKGPRIRQGSPQEEAALAAHLAGLAPGAAALQDAGSLAEALVALGAEAAAAALQAALTRLVAAQKVRRLRRSHPDPPPTPNLTLLISARKSGDETAHACRDETSPVGLCLQAIVGARALNFVVIAILRWR